MRYADVFRQVKVAVEDCKKEEEIIKLQKKTKKFKKLQRRETNNFK